MSFLLSISRQQVKCEDFVKIWAIFADRKTPVKISREFAFGIILFIHFGAFTLAAAAVLATVAVQAVA